MKWVGTYEISSIIKFKFINPCKYYEMYPLPIVIVLKISAHYNTFWISNKILLKTKMYF